MREEAKYEKIAHLMTQIQVLVKHVMGAEYHKVNVVGSNEEGI